MLPRYQRNRETWRPYVILGSGVALFALLVAFWFSSPWGSTAFPDGEKSPQLSPTQTPAVSASDAETVAGVLVDLVSDPTAGAAAETESSVNPAVAIPPGSKLLPDQTTWSPDGIGGGTMDVVLSTPGLPDQQFVAVMVREDGEWKVLGTLDKSEGITGP